MDLWVWAAFVAFIVVVLAFDLLVLHRDAHEVSRREAATWSAIWVALGLAFGGILWAWQGGTMAGEYFAGYLIEKSLSVDNVFVFALIFSYFAVPPAYQHRVLFWGVLGAIVLRAIFIGSGAALLEAFHWIIYIFGAFLVFTGIKMARHQELDLDPAENPVLKLLRRVIPLGSEYSGQRFFVRDGAKLVATPLFAVLVLIETTDVVFAVDSIPAIFAVTRDPFVVFTSNVFAILGLRALYFLLADAAGRLAYLKVGLSVVLVFVGSKMLMTGVYKVPIWLLLGVIGLVLAVSIVASLGKPPPRRYGEDVPVPDPLGLLTKQSAKPGGADPVGESREGRAG